MKSVHCNERDHEAGLHEAEAEAIAIEVEAKASFLGLEAEAPRGRSEDLTSLVISLKCGKIGTRLLLRSNRKSYTRF